MTRFFPDSCLRRALNLLLLSFFFLPALPAQQISPELLHGLKWRLIGPYRGGRVTAVAGDSKTYYMGTPGGGVWKTTDAGTTWFPLFDAAHVASIGDLVVAPSNPNIIYVATGEQSPGNGLWKSTDAGATWHPVSYAGPRVSGLCGISTVATPFIHSGHLDTNYSIYAAGRVAGPAPGLDGLAGHRHDRRPFGRADRNQRQSELPEQRKFVQLGRGFHLRGYADSQQNDGRYPGDRRTA